MLSSLPKLADKNFLIGFIMPVLLGATGLLALLRDLPPFDGIYRSLLSTDDFTKLTIVVLTLWAVAILLLLLNLLLYRASRDTLAHSTTAAGAARGKIDTSPSAMSSRPPEP